MSSANFKHSNLTLAFLIAVSIFGLVLSIFFVVNPSSLEDDFSFRNLTVGSAFGALCILGIFAGLFPSLNSANRNFEKRNRYDQSTHAIHETTLRAHHPSCENYSTHILNIGNMKFCATCSGLIVGATIVLFGTGLYFFGSLHIGEPFTLVSVGAAGVISSLLQSALPRFSVGFTRFFASTIFVIGCFLMLVSINEATKNTSVDLFFVALCVLWIFTKITLSQRDHQQTCLHCATESCRYYKKRKC
jgi:hypothetical protein